MNASTGSSADADRVDGPVWMRVLRGRPVSNEGSWIAIVWSSFDVGLAGLRGGLCRAG